MSKYTAEEMEYFKIAEAVEGFGDVLGNLGYDLPDEDAVVKNVRAILGMWEGA